MVLSLLMWLTPFDPDLTQIILIMLIAQTKLNVDQGKKWAKLVPPGKKIWVRGSCLLFDVTAPTHPL